MAIDWSKAPTYSNWFGDPTAPTGWEDNFDEMSTWVDPFSSELDSVWDTQTYDEWRDSIPEGDIFMYGTVPSIRDENGNIVSTLEEHWGTLGGGGSPATPEEPPIDYSVLANVSTEWLPYEWARLEYGEGINALQEQMWDIEIEYSGGIGRYESNFNPWPTSIKEQYQELGDQRTELQNQKGEAISNLTPSSLRKNLGNAATGIVSDIVDGWKQDAVSAVKALGESVIKSLVSNLGDPSYKDFDYKKLGTTPLNEVPGLRWKDNPQLNIIASGLGITGVKTVNDLNDLVGVFSESSAPSDGYPTPGKTAPAQFGNTGVDTRTGIAATAKQLGIQKNFADIITPLVEEAFGTWGETSELTGNRIPNKLDDFIRSVDNQTDKGTQEFGIAFVLGALKEEYGKSPDEFEQLKQHLQEVQPLVTDFIVDAELKKFDQDPIRYALKNVYDIDNRFTNKDSTDLIPFGDKTLEGVSDPLTNPSLDPNKIFQGGGLEWFTTDNMTPDQIDIVQDEINAGQKLGERATGKNWQDLFVRQTEQDKIKLAQQVMSGYGKINKFGEVVPNLKIKPGDTVSSGGIQNYGKTDYQLRPDGTLGMPDDNWADDIDDNELENLIPGLELAQQDPNLPYWMKQQQQYPQPDETQPAGTSFPNTLQQEFNKIRNQQPDIQNRDVHNVFGANPWVGDEVASTDTGGKTNYAWESNLPSWFSIDSWGGSSPYFGSPFPEEGLRGTNHSGGRGVLIPHLGARGKPGETTSGYGSPGYDFETNSGGWTWDFKEEPTAWNPLAALSIAWKPEPPAFTPTGDYTGLGGGLNQFPERPPNWLRDKRHKGKKKINLPEPWAPSGGPGLKSMRIGVA